MNNWIKNYKAYSKTADFVSSIGSKFFEVLDFDPTFILNSSVNLLS